MRAISFFHLPFVPSAALSTLFFACGGSVNMSTAATVNSVAPAHPSSPAAMTATRTPIKHAIVIIGENRTFDHIFATYRPKRSGEKVWNLLSRGIVQEDGSPGASFGDALQRSASDTTEDGFALNPRGRQPYTTLPTPLAGGPQMAPFTTRAAALTVEEALAFGGATLLTTGATGIPAGKPDTRIANVDALPPGPFQITPGIRYDSYAASPVHRFYQMWQELDCDATTATTANPSGCRNDLYPWVETSVGAGANGMAQPSPFDPASTGEGATAMGFYNVLSGDAPYLTQLADHYAMSDNYHQAVMGGTGANHAAIMTGDAMWYSDGNGHPAIPPASDIENPNAQAGTNDWYAQDGYSGGSYSDCSSANEPGVGVVHSYLAALKPPIDPHCEAGHYYLLNNYAPGYRGDGSRAPDTFALPPSNVRTIGDALSERSIDWRYYGEHWNRYLADPGFTNPANGYCNICNVFQYTTSIMTDAKARTAHLQDTTDLYSDIAAGSLPAVAFVKPSEFVDGHPATSKLDLFESFVQKLIEAVQAEPELWSETAIFVTFDEGGGYYDSGYVQPVDFFGDGPRIPLIVVSPYTSAGHVSHVYSDHVSILKFIEHNWSVEPLTGRSRDNLPEPVTAAHDDPYVPANRPAIGDLMDLFTFATDRP